jgi:hypothetical protein
MLFAMTGAERAHSCLKFYYELENKSKQEISCFCTIFDIEYFNVSAKSIN